MKHVLGAAALVVATVSAQDYNCPGMTLDKRNNAYCDCVDMM